MSNVSVLALMETKEFDQESLVVKFMRFSELEKRAHEKQKLKDRIDNEASDLVQVTQNQFIIAKQRFLNEKWIELRDGIRNELTRLDKACKIWREFLSKFEELDQLLQKCLVSIQDENHNFNSATSINDELNMIQVLLRISKAFLDYLSQNFLDLFIYLLSVPRLLAGIVVYFVNLEPILLFLMFKLQLYSLDIQFICLFIRQILELLPFFLQTFADQLSDKNPERHTLHAYVQNLKTNTRGSQISAEHDLERFEQEWVECETKLKTRIEFLTILQSNLELQELEKTASEFEMKLECLEIDLERHSLTGSIKNIDNVEAELDYCKVRNRDMIVYIGFDDLFSWK